MELARLDLATFWVRSREGSSQIRRPNPAAPVTKKLTSATPGRYSTGGAIVLHLVGNRETPPLRGREKTGATGLQPATSGVNSATVSATKP